MNILLKLYPNLNLGDDLFLKIICERYSDTNFLLLADQRYKDFNKWENLNVYNPKDKSLFTDRIKRGFKRKFFPSKFQLELYKYYLKQNKEVFQNVDGFVSIGGSIFIQVVDNILLDTEIAYYDIINRQFEGKPKFFIGCNFGPFKTQSYLMKFKDIFKQYSDICFRENFSYNLFKEMPNVRLAPDVVFSMNVAKVHKIANSVGFSIVSARKGVEKYSYIAKYVELIQSYNLKGFKVFLFSFCKEEGDEAIINEIIKVLGSDVELTRVFYNGNIDDFLKIYSQVEYMFCGRFHAMILSMLYNQKIYPIAYSEKMKNTLEDINYQGDIIDAKVLCNEKVERIVDQFDKNDYNIYQLRQEAVKQFQQLDEFLK